MATYNILTFKNNKTNNISYNTVVGTQYVYYSRRLIFLRKHVIEVCFLTLTLLYPYPCIEFYAPTH